MKPIETLMAEHRVIEKEIAAAEEACEEAENGRYQAERFENCLDFFRNYADKRHHGKEEARLFPKLVARGLPADMGPVACMTAEHDQGRALLARAETAFPAARNGDAAAQGEVVEAFSRFAAFLRDHIQKEDRILFPMADGMLTPEDQSALAAEFARFDAEEVKGPGPGAT